MTPFPDFVDWIAARLGTHQWVVAPRLTAALRAKGYALAVSQKRFAALQDEFNRAKPPNTQWSPAETAELIRHLTAECERAARHFRHYDKNPADLRAWAHRIETNFAPNGNNLAALTLENAARAGREFLAAEK